MIQRTTTKTDTKRPTADSFTHHRVLEPVAAGLKRSELAKLSDQELNCLPTSRLLQIIRETLPALRLSSVDRELLIKLVSIVRTDCRAELLDTDSGLPAWV